MPVGGFNPFSGFSSAETIFSGEFGGATPSGGNSGALFNGLSGDSLGPIAGTLGTAVDLFDTSSIPKAPPIQQSFSSDERPVFNLGQNLSAIRGIKAPGAVGGGILKGASAGAAFGPIGAGVGALVGAIGGLFKKRKARKRRKRAKRKFREAVGNFNDANLNFSQQEQAFDQFQARRDAPQSFGLDLNPFV